jgi:hypothetical protein
MKTANRLLMILSCGAFLHGGTCASRADGQPEALSSEAREPVVPPETGGREFATPPPAEKGQTAAAPAPEGGSRLRAFGKGLKSGWPSRPAAPGHKVGSAKNLSEAKALHSKPSAAKHPDPARNAQKRPDEARPGNTPAKSGPAKSAPGKVEQARQPAPSESPGSVKGGATAMATHNLSIHSVSPRPARPATAGRPDPIRSRAPETAGLGGAAYMSRNTGMIRGTNLRPRH